MFDGKVGYDYQRQFKFGVVKLKKKKIILDNIRKQQYNNDGRIGSVTGASLLQHIMAFVNRGLEHLDFLYIYKNQKLNLQYIVHINK